jgi:hypothetical protein
VIDVHYKVLIDHSITEEQETWETLSIEIDETRRLSFRNKEGESLTTERVVFYTLTTVLPSCTADLVKSLLEKSERGFLLRVRCAQKWADFFIGPISEKLFLSER